MSADAIFNLLTWLLIGTFALLCLILIVFGIGVDPAEHEHRRQRQEHRP